LKTQQLTLVRILRAIHEIARNRKPKLQLLGNRGVKVKTIRRVEEDPLF
jgi:hypothetical protein